MTREKKKEYYQVKYEKMPDFCAHCGMLGHWYEECGTGSMIQLFLNGETSSWPMAVVGVVEVEDKEEAVGVEVKTYILADVVEGEVVLQQEQFLIQELRCSQMI
jgi:hypothetical protein